MTALTCIIHECAGDSCLERAIKGKTDLVHLAHCGSRRLMVFRSLWWTEADPAQLENVLLNLAINARDAMPDGGKLTIETSNAYLDSEFQQRHPDVPQGQYVMLAVSDTGHGMTANVTANALTPFCTTEERGRGSGLGLSMVFGFVSQSGVYLDVYSEVGEGTTIRIYLRRSHANKADSPATYTTTAEPGSAGECVLVVEDDDDVRRLTVSLLGELGYVALEASDAGRALKILDASPGIVLLLTDVVLSGSMHGDRLGREARARHPDLQVLFMSGYTEKTPIKFRLDIL